MSWITGGDEMNNFRFILISALIFSLSLVVVGYGEDMKDGKINENQPISIGESIYRNMVIDDVLTIFNSYMYAGYENNTIKVEVKNIISSSKVISESRLSTDILILPVNKKKQALLKVKTLNDAQPNKEILITVVDDFFRIKAEEFKP